MKKIELYQSIETLKPDNSMKNRIMNAVEAKDVIAVRKRPIFVPIAIALLLVVNVGIAGNFLLRDEFNGLFSDHSQSEKNAFELYADNVYNEINKHSYVKLEYIEWDNNYVPTDSEPWYETYSAESLGNVADELNDTHENIYVRYVQREDFFYTNHEYIIGYDGNGYDKENIISITESNVEYSHDSITARIGENHKTMSTIKNTEEMREIAFNYILDIATKDGEEIAAVENNYDLNIYNYAICGYDSLGMSCYRFPVEHGDVSGYVMVDEGGKIVNLDNYWKPTMTADGTVTKPTEETTETPVYNAETVIMPYILGFTLPEAEIALKEAGLMCEVVYLGGSSATDESPYVALAEPSAEERINVNGTAKIYIMSEKSYNIPNLLDTELKLDFSYREGGIDYYSNDQLYPDMIFEGFPDEKTGMIMVTGISTKGNTFEMCPSVFVGMTLDEVQQQVLLSDGFYQENYASDIVAVDSSSGIGNYNYYFTYTVDNVLYQVHLNVNDNIISDIYIRKEDDKSIIQADLKQDIIDLKDQIAEAESANDAQIREKLEKEYEQKNKELEELEQAMREAELENDSQAQEETN